LKRLATGGALAFLVAAGVSTASTGAHAAPAPAPQPNANAKALAARSADNLVASSAAQLHASPDDGFTARPVVSVPEGVQYVPYERTYKNLKVIGGDFVVVTDAAGNVKFTSVGQSATIGNLATSPTVSRSRAQTVARGQLKHVDSATAPQLVVYASGAKPALAWESVVAGTDGSEPSRLSVYVDANTGKVLGSKEHVVHGDGTGAYNGPSPLHLDTTQTGSTFTMKDPSITNLSCQDASNNTTFSGPDDLWGNGTVTSRETGCVDALFAAQTEYKMLAAWLGRNGQDGNGGAWPIRVGLDDLNAFYDGTQVQIGHNQAGGWIGSLDVVGHEMGHGVDDHTPGGISGNGTQEFVADTYGAMTEWYANEGSSFDPPDYQVGEEINLVGNGPIRYMYNPSLAGHANCYSSSIPTAEVHAAAGPGNHWFYLIAEGTNPTDGQPTSPTCNSTSVTGLGIQKAGKIMYNAMLAKTSSVSYLKYRTLTLQAAKNLFPGSCTEFNTVKAAWDAVSVPAQSGDPSCTGGGGSVTVTNPGSKTGTVGAAISNITLSASGGTAPYTWTSSGLQAGLSLSTDGVISGTPTTAGTSNVTVTAKDSLNVSGSASFTFTINPAGGGGCSGQKLGNPGFETGTAAPWTASAGVIDNSTSQPAHSGSWKGWLDGYGSSHTDSLSKSVTIPAGCSASLTFFVHIDSAETTATTAYDKLTVKAGTTRLATYSNLNKASGYAQKTLSLAAFAGQTVTITFTGVEDSSLQTSFVIDDTAVTLS